MARKSNIFTRILELVLDKASAEKTKKGAQDAINQGTDPKAARRNLAAVGTAIRQLLAPLAAVLSIRQVVQWADSWKLVQGRLRNVTADSEELRDVQGKLFDMAQRTRSEYESVAQLYTRVAQNAEQLGRSQEELLQLTETTLKAIQVSGASASEAAAGTQQLAQALASGTLQGDEFRSIMENLPGLARAIADGLGVTTGELRSMSKAGDLTADAVVGAILKMKDSVDKDFASVPLTVGAALTVLRNNVIATIADIDKGTAATEELAKAIVGLGSALDWVVHGLQLFGVGAAVLVEQFRTLAIATNPRFWFTEEGRKRIDDQRIALERLKEAARDVGNEITGNGPAATNMDRVSAFVRRQVGFVTPAEMAAAKAAAEGFAKAAQEAAEAMRRLAEEKREMLLDAQALGIATEKETTSILKRHQTINEALKAGNLTLAQRLALTEEMRRIESVIPFLVRPDDGRQVPGTDPLWKPPETHSMPGILDPREEQRLLAEHYTNQWTEAYSEVQGAAERAAMGVTGAWQDAFSAITTEGLGLAGGLEALFRGSAGAVLGMLADVAASKVLENVARAFEQAALASGRAAVFDFAGAALHAASAKGHGIAAAKWAIIGGLAAGAQSSVASGGRGGRSGGLPTGARDPQGRMADRAGQLGPEVHIHFIGEGFSAVNPEVQRVVLGATQLAQERYGQNARVRIHRDSD